MLTKRKSCLRTSSNPSNLAHCVAVGYEKMQVINSSALRERMAESFAWLLPEHEPFRDLSARKWTEVAVSKSDVSLFRGSELGKTLASGNAPSVSGDLALTGLLRPGEQVVLSLSSDLCLELVDTLPKVNAAKTEAILGFSNLRTLPMAKADYVWGWFQQAQDELQQHCKKVILRKDILNSALATIAKAGATCHAIVIRPNQQAAYPIALQPDGSIYDRDRFSLWAKVLTWGVVALMTASTVFVATAWRRQNQDIAAIASETVTVTAEMTSFREKLSNDKRSRQAVFELSSRKSNEPKLSTLLNTLSGALPDSAFITGFRTEGASATIDGLAVDPEGLVSTLEATPLFSNVTFAGPVTHNPGEEKSRFSLHMDVEPPMVKP